MKKTKKRVKFELPNRTDNATTTTTRPAQPTFQLEMLPEVRTSPHPQLYRNSSMQRKIRSHIRSALPVPYNSSVLHHPSSMTTGSRRPVAAIYPATDNKINSYLTRPKASYDTSPTSQTIKPYVNTRNTYADQSIFRSARITLQLTNLYAKTPPIDITRKFCTICPVKQRYFTTTSKSMLLSMMKPSDKEPFGRLSALISPSTSPSSSNPNSKMGLLHLSKIVSESRRHSFFPDINISRKREFTWKPAMLAVEISTPSSSTHLSTSLTKEVAKPSAMKLQYVTERIIVALFPSDSTDAQYRTDLKDATVLLRRKHAEHYKIFNISKRRSDLGRLHSVIELGWPEELAPPLDRLCAICKLLENWLSANSANVVVIHCKGGCSRAAIVIASYMHYITICSVDESIGIRFALQQFSERYLGPDGQPSHKRYVKYFSSLLCGRTKIQPATVYLHNIVLTNFLGRNVLFKIYERMQPVHTTSLKVVNESETFELGNLPLRGDILVKCFQRTSTAERTPFFRCQFNTCTFDLSTSHNENVYKLRFYREELDDIFNDSEVNSQAMIEFVFQREVPKSSSDDANGCCDDVARTSIADYSRADSYENFDKEEGW